MLDICPHLCSWNLILNQIPGYAVGRRKVESLFLMCRPNPTHSISTRSDETRYSPQNHGWNECGMNSYCD